MTMRRAPAVAVSAALLCGVTLFACPIKPRAQSTSQAAAQPALPSAAQGAPPLAFSFTNVAAQAGLTAQTIYGGRDSNRYLLETTGSGVALIDADRDGFLDIFLVNGTTLEGFPKGQEPTAHLYRNKRDGTFEDITDKAGLRQSGWGQGACVGDVDSDGWDDLYVTYWGQNRLFRNKGAGDGAFEDITARAGLTTPRRWGAGCAFLDYDRDGALDLFAANYIDMDLASTPVPESGLCRYKGIAVACGPPGLKGGKNALYRGKGDGTFTDVSVASGVAAASGTYGLGVTTLDFDDDGWVDVYVANDSNPSTLYRNNHDGTFRDIGVRAGCAYSQDGKPQAGMGLAIGDYDRNGTFDIFKTNFAGDTSTLYGNPGNGFCEDRTFAAGIGLNTRYLGWGVGFVDFDHDGWLDLFLVNGHVYPEVKQLTTEAPYKQRKVVYRNLGGVAGGAPAASPGGAKSAVRFEDVTDRLGEPATTPKAGRGAAFGDLDNDGDLDIVINNVHDTPDLFRTERTAQAGHWITLTLVPTSSHRNAIGARVRVTAGAETWVDEVRGGGSYYAQNDSRLHVGVGAVTRIDRVDVRWPNGREQSWKDLPIDRFVTLKEGVTTPEVSTPTSSAGGTRADARNGGAK